MTTRRQLLRSAAATTLIAPLASAAAKKKVLIIGAGIGGLSCGYDLVQRGHDVTILEASRRAGGHVKTIQLDGGLYADVGAEHFTNPGYDAYRHWVEHFKLDVIPYKRRRNMYRRIDGTWYTEQQLADPAVVRSFGFNEREVSH
jgi:monoamine oxidase